MLKPCSHEYAKVHENDVVRVCSDPVDDGELRQQPGSRKPHCKYTIFGTVLGNGKPGHLQRRFRVQDCMWEVWS